jgi:hypothetical protein
MIPPRALKNQRAHMGGQHIVLAVSEAIDRQPEVGPIHDS